MAGDARPAALRGLRGMSVDDLVRRVRREPRARARSSLGEGSQIVPGSGADPRDHGRGAHGAALTTLALVVPWVTVLPVAAAFASPTRPPASPTSPLHGRLRAGLREVSVDLRAEVGAPPRPRPGPRAAARRHRPARRHGRRRRGRVRRRRARPPRPRRALGTHRASNSSGPSAGRRRDERRRTADAPGRITAEAVERALQNAAPGAARVGAIIAGGGSEQAAEQAVQGLAMPAVCAEVSYIHGVTGGNVFLLPVEAHGGCRDDDGNDTADAVEGAELSELELSAVGEAMNQMMSAAALATSGVLGQEVEIAPPKIRVITTEAEAAEMLRASAAPHVLTTSFTVADVSARLVQLVPNAFVVRMDRALDAQTTEYTTAPLGAALRAVPVRVWAELGRARMPAGTSLGPAHRLGRRARPRGRGSCRPLRRRPALRHRSPARGRGRQPAAPGRDGSRPAERRRSGRAVAAPRCGEPVPADEPARRAGRRGRARRRRRDDRARRSFTD